MTIRDAAYCTDKLLAFLAPLSNAPSRRVSSNTHIGNWQSVRRFFLSCYSALEPTFVLGRCISGHRDWKYDFKSVVNRFPQKLTSTCAPPTTIFLSLAAACIVLTFLMTARLYLQQFQPVIAHIVDRIYTVIHVGASTFPKS